MAKIANIARDIDTGDPFTAGNATIYGPDGATLATPALNGTTGLWSWQANGQPGKTLQEYIALGQVKRVDGGTYGQAGATMEGELEGFFQLFTSGVFNGFLVTAPGGMAVQVGIGYLLNLGVLHPIYTAENVTIAAAHATLARIDRVVSRLTRTGTFAGRVLLAVVAGTPAASPAVPALTNDANTNEVEVARVTVPAAASAIVTGNISITTRPTATAPISDGSITQAKLAKPSVGTPELFDASVTSAKLAAGLLTSNLGVFPGLIANYWISPRNILSGVSSEADNSVNNVVADTLYGCPIFIPADTQLKRIAVQRVGGGATVTARVGLYNTGTNGLPTTLFYDGGQIAMGATTGIKQINTVTVALPKGFYWAAMVLSFSSGTCRVQTLTAARDLFGDPGAGGDAPNAFVQGVHTNVTSLPSPYPAPGVAEAGPQLFIQTSGT